MGTFFKRLRIWLQTQGAEVYKVNLNGGDWLFDHGAHTLDYRGRLEDFGVWLGQLLQQQRIDALLCFGDCRAYHRLAARVARARGLPLFVFEEGYLRPDYITLEQGGVNAYSPLIKRSVCSLRRESVAVAEPQAAHPCFRRMALSAMAYYGAAWLLRWRYPHYQHHKNFSVFSESFYWLRSGWRKLMYRSLQRALIRRLRHDLRQQYFLVALQVFNDSQILHHSPYGDIREFIAEVLDSFARHAAADQHLLFKHHPLDRGHRNYRQLIVQLAQRAGISERVHYVHDAPLPELLKHCIGVVTVNSTVGLSALHHGKPLLTMGRALYDVPGLSGQDGLDRFWRRLPPVDATLYRQLRACMVRSTQLNGAFYGRDHWMQHGAVRPAPAIVPVARMSKADARCVPLRAPR